MKVVGDWLSSASSQAVLKTLTAAGHGAFFVGGCVRNALLDHPVSDIDVATSARPVDVIQIAENAGFRAIPTGIEHGTVTVVVADTAYEITTFRRDVETDGRRATVAFSDRIEDDARRRDFTMNALYADAAGTVIDPLGGLEDLKERRVRFIEDASTRIREDYLRILRFFRFYAWFGDPDIGLDPDGLAACAVLSDGIAHLSKERIGAEMLKLLSAPNPAPAVAAMRHAGVLAQALPGADDTFLGPLVHLEAETEAAPLRRLAILGGEDLAGHLRLSKADARQLELLKEAMGDGMPAKELGYRHGVSTAQDVMLLRAAIAGMPVRQQDRADIETGAHAVFPIAAADLMPTYEGPELGQKLRELEQSWIDSGFLLTKSDLLD